MLRRPHTSAGPGTSAPKPFGYTPSSLRLTALNPPAARAPAPINVKPEPTSIHPDLRRVDPPLPILDLPLFPAEVKPVFPLDRTRPLTLVMDLHKLRLIIPSVDPLTALRTGTADQPNPAQGSASTPNLSLLDLGFTHPLPSHLTPHIALSPPSSDGATTTALPAIGSEEREDVHRPPTRWRMQAVQPASPFYEALLGAAKTERGDDVDKPLVAPSSRLSRAHLGDAAVPEEGAVRGRKKPVLSASRPVPAAVPIPPRQTVSANGHPSPTIEGHIPREEQDILVIPPVHVPPPPPLSPAEQVRQTYLAQQRMAAQEAAARLRLTMERNAKAELAARLEAQHDVNGAAVVEGMPPAEQRMLMDFLGISTWPSTARGPPVEEIAEDPRSRSPSDDGSPIDPHIRRPLSMPMMPTIPLSTYSQTLAGYRFPAASARTPTPHIRESVSPLAQARLTSAGRGGSTSNLLHPAPTSSGLKRHSTTRTARPGTATTHRPPAPSPAPEPISCPLDIVTFFGKAEMDDPFYPIWGGYTMSDQLARVRASLVHAITLLHLLIVAAQHLVEQNNTTIALLKGMEVAARPPGSPESRRILDYGMPTNAAIDLDRTLAQWWFDEVGKLNLLWTKTSRELGKLVEHHQYLVRRVSADELVNMLSAEEAWGGRLEAAGLEEMGREWAEGLTKPSPVTEQSLLEASSKLEEAKKVSPGTFRRFNNRLTGRGRPSSAQAQAVDRVEAAVLERPVSSGSGKRGSKRIGKFASGVAGLVGKVTGKKKEEKKGPVTVYGFIDHTMRPTPPSAPFEPAEEGRERREASDESAESEAQALQVQIARTKAVSPWSSAHDSGSSDSSGPLQFRPMSPIQIDHMAPPPTAAAPAAPTPTAAPATALGSTPLSAPTPAHVQTPETDPMALLRSHAALALATATPGPRVEAWDLEENMPGGTAAEQLSSSATGNRDRKTGKPKRMVPFGRDVLPGSGEVRVKPEGKRPHTAGRMGTGSSLIHRFGGTLRA